MISIQQFNSDLKDESIFDIEGIKNDQKLKYNMGIREDKDLWKSYSTYTMHVNRLPNSTSVEKSRKHREFIINVGIYRFRQDGGQSNLDYINEVLFAYNYPSVYPRKPDEVVYFFCLLNNMTINEYIRIISSTEYTNNFVDTNSILKDDNANANHYGENEDEEVVITIDWIRNAIKVEQSASSETMHYTMIISNEIQEISKKSEKKDDIICKFLEYINSEKYLERYARTRATTLYYYRKNIEAFIKRKIEKIETIQNKSIELEYDENDPDFMMEAIRNIRNEITSAIEDCPFINLKLPHLIIEDDEVSKNIYSMEDDNTELDNDNKSQSDTKMRKDKYGVIPKSQWIQHVRDDSALGFQYTKKQLINRKAYLEQKIMFDDLPINKAALGQRLLYDTCNFRGLSEKEAKKINEKVGGYYISILKGDLELNRELLAFVMLANDMTIDEVNGVLSGCGFRVISDSVIDEVLLKVAHKEKITLEELKDIGIALTREK